MADLGKGVFHARPGACDAPVSAFLASAQGFARLGFTLNVLPIAQRLEHLSALFAGVTLICVNILAGVVRLAVWLMVRRLWVKSGGE